MDASPDKIRRLALHTCCGPCLIEPLDALRQLADEVVVVYSNPNIAPAEEYLRRFTTMRRYAETVGVDVVELPYEPRVWAATAGRVAGDKADRCRACYRLRLELTSAWADEAGCDVLATTLTVSPYQDHDALREEGERAAEMSGLRYLDCDFRSAFRRAQQRARELGMYRQNYCGCAPSAAEAEAERASRREVRLTEKAARKLQEAG